MCRHQYHTFARGNGLVEFLPARDGNRGKEVLPTQVGQPEGVDHIPTEVEHHPVAHPAEMGLLPVQRSAQISRYYAAPCT